MSSEKQPYNPYCLVAYCHFEATGKKLSCEACYKKDCTQKERKDDEQREDD